MRGVAFSNGFIAEPFEKAITCVAVLGTIHLTICVLQIVTGIILLTVTTIMGFGLRKLFTPEFLKVISKSVHF